jgi:putative ABC transport system permease protein
VHREIARPSLRAFFSLDDRAAQQQAGRASYRARQQGGRPAAFDPALRPPLASFLSLDPPLDPDAARAAAEQGDALAQLTLGRRLLGAPGTQAEALRWLRRAADQGHREARWLLARHSPADEAGSAARWLQQAAEQGLPQAQHDLALRLGGPDAPDPSLFLRWIERAAEQQFIPSQLALGDALAAGRGAPPDPTRALVWYLRAARQQSAEACARLAAFFLSGISVTRDPVRGLHWARLAAEGDAHGHYLLALCLREGWGLDPDGPAALSHLQAAARGGSALARSALADPAPAAWPIADPRANDRLGPIDPPPEADLLRSFAVESRAEGRRQARDLARGPGARYRPVQVIFSFFSALVIALRSVRRNALRASLTILGILIGITAVVVVTALGAGARRSVTASIANLGSNAVMVFPQAANVSGAKGVGARLTEDDGHALLREATSIKAWAPLRRSPVQAVFEGRNAATNAIGSNRSYLEVRAWKLGSGAIWEESSESVKEKVCVIGTTVRDALFGSLDPIGRMIRIGRHSYRVLGVLESKGQAPIGGDQDDIVLMPIGTFNSHVSWAPPGTVNALFLSAASDEVSERAVRQTDEILRQRHHIGAGKEPDFVVRSQAEFQQLQQSIFGALTILLVAVAGVSLLVGGIGVMNIMLVSVAERTREIGIRMAIGARENDILLQFLIEAVVLSILGGIAGISLSFVIVTVLSKAVGFDLGVDLDALLIALGTSTAIGVVFGFFPARRAARLDPIQALGRE